MVQVEWNFLNINEMFDRGALFLRHIALDRIYNVGSELMCRAEFIENTRMSCDSFLGVPNVMTMNKMALAT